MCKKEIEILSSGHLSCVPNWGLTFYRIASPLILLKFPDFTSSQSRLTYNYFMADRSIIIIGAGMGGLAAGIYARMNGYETRIFEMHSKPGGQCAGWKRKEYIFDGCIHDLFGCSPHSKIYDLWQELGAMPREMVRTDECTSVLSPEGKLFYDYYDLGRLEEHLNSLCRADQKAIRDYIRGIQAFSGRDAWGDSVMGKGGVLRTAKNILPMLPWIKPTMREFGQKFSDPFLRRAFPFLLYNTPEISVMIHLIRHGYGLNNAIQWPIGGSREFARSLERKYRDLGGEVLYKSRVEKILVEHDAAKGIRLADGTEHRADLVISNADGRKTIMEMLGNNYTNERIRQYCGEPPDEMNFGVHVFLGANRDLSREPSNLVMLLDAPVVIAGHEQHSIAMQMYGCDRTMAPAGKGVIKVELFSRYSFWKELYADRERYAEEKQKIASQVIGILEQRYFSGLASQVEVIDVPTIITWERYMGGTHGFANLPNKKMSLLGSLFRKEEMTLPRLSGFSMVGQWVSSATALFMNALSGRKAIQAICERDGKSLKLPAASCRESSILREDC